MPTLEEATGEGGCEMIGVNNVMGREERASRVEKNVKGDRWPPARGF